VLDTKTHAGSPIRHSLHVDTNQPIDHTMGDHRIIRNGEFQEEQISVGGDFHWQMFAAGFDHVRSLQPRRRAMTPAPESANGTSATLTATSRKLTRLSLQRESRLNIDAGYSCRTSACSVTTIFDNWTYQPSYVSSNTPVLQRCAFSGSHQQLKIEPGSSTDGSPMQNTTATKALGGNPVSPYEWLSMVFNNYGNGTMTWGSRRSRIHTDDSLEIRYSASRIHSVSKMAFSLTADAGCEYGAGVTCHGASWPKQAFLG